MPPKIGNGTRRPSGELRAVARRAHGRLVAARAQPPVMTLDRMSLTDMVMTAKRLAGVRVGQVTVFLMNCVRCACSAFRAAHNFLMLVSREAPALTIILNANASARAVFGAIEQLVSALLWTPADSARRPSPRWPLPPPECLSHVLSIDFEVSVRTSRAFPGCEQIEVGPSTISLGHGGTSL